MITYIETKGYTVYYYIWNITDMAVSVDYMRDEFLKSTCKELRMAVTK